MLVSARILSLVLAGVLTSCGEDDKPSPRPPAPPSYYRPCGDDSDCEGGLVCTSPFLINRVCSLVCESDEECPLTSVCLRHANGNKYCADVLGRYKSDSGVSALGALNGSLEGQE
jgi:hypothetical protein